MGLPSAPVVLVLLVALVVGAGLVVTAVRRRELAPAVADARRYGAAAGGIAVLAGVAAAVAVGLADPAAPLGPGVSAALAPLVFAVVHTAVLGVGESAWPRPRGALRTASLTPRRFPDRLRRWQVVLLLAAAGVVLAALTGWSTAAPDGRTVTGSPVVLPGGLASLGPPRAGPYPGSVFAVPVLIGTAVLLVVVALAVRTALVRAAVPGGGAAEAVLRAASVHRVLRGAVAGLLVELGGLLAFGALAVRSIAHGTSFGTGTGAQVVGEQPVVLALAGAVAVLGAVVALAGLAALLVPAPRLRPAGPAAPPPSVVPARLP